MRGQDNISRNCKRVVGVTIVGLALAIMFCELDGVAKPGWNLFDEAVWVALEVLRPVILAGWQSVPTYLCQNSRFLRHLLPIVASIWPLFSVMAG